MNTLDAYRQQRRALMRGINGGAQLEAEANNPVPGGAELADPGVVLPGLLFAAGCYLGRIGTLAHEVSNDQRNRDWHAALLLRSLYEYVVTFCWIAADATDGRCRDWVADDLRYRLISTNELEDLGAPPMDPAIRAQYQAAVDAATRLPNVETRARAADAHWGATIPEFLLGHTSPNPGHLTDYYPLIYRTCSSVGHPTARALQACFVHPTGTPGKFAIGTTSGTAKRHFYTKAPFVFSLALRVAPCFSTMSTRAALNPLSQAGPPAEFEFRIQGRPWTDQPTETRPLIFRLACFETPRQQCP